MLECCLLLVKELIQATPAMSTSRISILPLMSKWFFIPNIFSLYFFAFQLRLCRIRLTWSNGYLEVIFHVLDVFSIIFAIVYVEVKIGGRMGVILSASAMYSAGEEKSPLFIFLHDQLPFFLGETGGNSGKFLQVSPGNPIFSPGNTCISPWNFRILPIKLHVFSEKLCYFSLKFLWEIRCFSLKF